MTSLHYIKKIVLIFCVLSSCKTYYAQNSKIFNLFENNDYDSVNKLLEKSKAYKGKNKLLHYMNRGTISFLLKDYESSNKFFNEADNINEDMVSHPGDVLLKYTINPKVTNYTPEDHEILFVHYFKIINYIFLNNLEDALVECRRLIVQLNFLNDKYKDDKKLYSNDAFFHLLLGIVYQADHNYNDAFIAYRNAIEVYEGLYKQRYNIEVPEQLKKDIIYVCYKLHDSENMRYYKEHFNLNEYNPSIEKNNNGDLLCFWNNGLNPVKEEFSLNFVITRVGDSSSGIFVNEEFGLAFPFPDISDEVFDLNIIRIAFPKYVERPLKYDNCNLIIDNNKHEFENVEDVNAIAFDVLKKRMHLELGQALLRFAIKKSAEILLRKAGDSDDKNPNIFSYLGMGLGLVNAITEQADTRCWMMLPHNIYYSRVSLPPGLHDISIDIDDQETTQIKIKPQKTTFHVFTTH